MYWWTCLVLCDCYWKGVYISLLISRLISNQVHCEKWTRKWTFYIILWMNLIHWWLSSPAMHSFDPGLNQDNTFPCSSHMLCYTVICNVWSEHWYVHPADISQTWQLSDVSVQVLYSVSPVDTRYYFLNFVKMICLKENIFYVADDIRYLHQSNTVVFTILPTVKQVIYCT